MRRNTNDTFEYWFGVPAGSTYVPYKEYVALLDVNASYAPTVTELNNTLGATLQWTSSGANILAISANTFTANKTWIMTGAAVATGSTPTSGNTVVGVWVNASTCSFSASAAPYIKSPIEIRVY